MGFLDSLFGLNTSQHQSNGMVSQDAALGNVINGNNGILNNQATAAQGALSTGATSALGQLQAGATSALGQIGQFGQGAQDRVQSGINDAVAAVQGSNGLFQPYAASGAAANGLYGDSVGLNGAAGNAAATAAFQASPGYQYQVNQSTDAAARKAASLGMAASGNTLDAITRLGSNLANQEYGDWQNKLSGLSGTGLTAANAISGNNAAAGNYQYGGNNIIGNLINGMGTSVAGIDTGLGTGAANVQNSLGTNSANIDTGLGNSLVGNNTQLATLINSNAMGATQAQDAAQNANNGIFSKLIGDIAGAGLKAVAL